MELRNYEYQSDFAKKYFAEGRRKGHEEGQRDLLRRLLAQRFGELPADLRERVDQATDDELARWGERILSAGSLTDVFASE